MRADQNLITRLGARSEARAEYRPSTAAGTATPTPSQININDARPSPTGSRGFIGYACRDSNPIASSSFRIPTLAPASHLDRRISRPDAFPSVFHPLQLRSALITTQKSRDASRRIACGRGSDKLRVECFVSKYSSFFILEEECSGCKLNRSFDFVAPLRDNWSSLIGD